MFTIGLPKWAMESTDPYVMRLVEESFLEGVGHVREFFDELIAGGACQDALLMQRKQEQDRRLYKSAYDDDDEIARRAMELYAAQAASKRTAVPDPRVIAKSVDRWEPGPDDIVLALELKAEQDFAAELLSEDAERDDDYGQESARVDPELDAIEHLLAWAGKTELVQRAPLATVLATIKAHWERYTRQAAPADHPHDRRDGCSGTTPGAWSSSTRASASPSTCRCAGARSARCTSAPTTPKPRPWWMRRWIAGKSSRRRATRTPIRRRKPRRRCRWRSTTRPAS